MEIQLIDNNRDDTELITGILESIAHPNEIIRFSYKTKVVDYLKPSGTYTFQIASGINMPSINGYDLREQIAQKFFRKGGYDVLHKRLRLIMSTC